MDYTGTFKNIISNDFKFKGCDKCEGICCNGARGFALSPLILEDFEDVYKNFAIVFSISNRKLKPYVVLNNGTSYCKYYINNKCSIYEKRPPACKLYPLSPYFDNILVDIECPSINTENGEQLSLGGKVLSSFHTKRLSNFNQKLQESILFYDSIYNINDFKFIGNILGMPLLKYTKESENKYIKMHLDSLVHYKKRNIIE